MKPMAGSETDVPGRKCYPCIGTFSYHELTLRATLPLNVLLKHLFVLIPTLDRYKHYWVGSEEIDKLLEKGEGWLAGHPEREWIVRRYLKYQKRLTREALERLAPEPEPEEGDEEAADTGTEPAVERKISLHDVRLDRVAEAIAALDPKSVIDLGCGEGRLLARLL